ncbi:MAG: hypothetical protein ACFFB2_02950 [Promethearchaeota archaeon]
MVRWKIREKKPSKEIKQKIPTNSKSSIIKSKFPNGAEEVFELPPPKQKLKVNIPKSSNSLPSRHGTIEPSKDDTPYYNVPPPLSDQIKGETSLKPVKSPIKEKDQNTVNSKTPPKSSSQQERSHAPPTSLGALSKRNRKKLVSNQPAPIPKHPNKEIKIPHSLGSSSKKKSNFVNKPVPRVSDKKPSAAIINMTIPTSRGAEKKKESKGINRLIPKKIKIKTPSRQKPPPTYEEKIPKFRIKAKKPRNS